MRRTIPLLTLVGLGLVGCPDPPPPPPAKCTTITEDNKASDHCSVDKADCEKTLSALLTTNHSNRCPVPPCTGFSASTTCTALNQDCKLGSGSIGMLFSTKERIRCR